MEVNITAGGLDRLAVDLGRAGRKATIDAMKVMAVAAVKIRDGMRQDFTGHRNAPAIPRAVDYTVRGLSIEVGVNKNGPQGGLGNLLAFGSSKNAAVVDHTAAMRRELPALERYLADVAEKSLG